MLAIVSRMYAEGLGIVYVLVDRDKKLHTITSEDYLYKIRDQVINYSIDRINKKKTVVKAWRPAIKVLEDSSLIFRTKDYFDMRDISVELYQPRVSTLLKTGRSKQNVTKYEVQKWVEKDRLEYENSDWLINQAIEYLKIKEITRS